MEREFLNGILVVLNKLGTYLLEEELITARAKLDLWLLHALWILATPDSFRSVALRFNVRPSTIHDHYLLIVNALCDLAPRYITWPSRDERHAIKTRFRNYSGFPGIIGCIDGTYIVLTAPTIQPRRYINRHHQFSLNVQAVCDHKLLVRDLHVGESGALNDARVFRRSPLSIRLLTDENITEPDEHLVGDSIYMLTDKLLTPYRNNGHLLKEQRVFNYILSKCRVRVEHCFGKLFSQWRRLKLLQSFNIEYAIKTVVACFVLHNMMILGGHETPEEMLENPDVAEEDMEEWDEFPDEVFEQMPPNLVAQNPMLRRLDAAHLAGVEKREHITAILRDRPMN